MTLGLSQIFGILGLSQSSDTMGFYFFAISETLKPGTVSMPNIRTSLKKKYCRYLFIYMNPFFQQKLNVFIISLDFDLGKG